MSSCCTPVNDQSDQGGACCSTTTSAVEPAVVELSRRCPVCGEKSKQVDTNTVKAMLDISLHTIRPGGYAFCRSEDCPVVYFALDGVQTLTEADLRVAVHQKHPDDDDVFVCYCFRHTPGAIRAELVETGQSTVVETVTEGTRSGQCAYEIRNPQGSCCLGNLRTVIERAEIELKSLSASIRATGRCLDLSFNNSNLEKWSCCVTKIRFAHDISAQSCIMLS